MQWKRYQIETAQFFRTLGCRAEEDATVEGARGLHKIDVWVRFNRFGVETRWVIECKHWSRSVPKEKVMVLKSVVEDIGADRGILISRAGFQSGAVLAVRNTNITLTSLVGLKETAQGDLISSLLHTLENKATALKYALHNLYVTEKTGPGSSVSRPLPGVDGNAVMHAGGKLALLEFGFDSARLRTPPYSVAFDESGKKRIVADTLEEFIELASRVIAEVQETLDMQSPYGSRL